LIDYRVFASRPAERVRLEIVDTPHGIRPGVVNIALFGSSHN
jgi:hypothetical protein